MSDIAIVTGAGSGVGRAIALKLAREGWRVALLGRREGMLRETAALAGDAAERMLPIACDVADESAVGRAVEAVRQRWGDATVLVNSAGTNIANRALGVLSGDDYRHLIDSNLNGAFYCVAAVLPGMRRIGRGTIVNIISDAGIQANAKAGAAYVASKFGLRGLTQSINAEQRQSGIRACAMFPGEINTPLLDKRQLPPPMETRARMLQPEDVAECAWLAINLPERAVVEELLVRPRV